MPEKVITFCLSPESTEAVLDFQDIQHPEQVTMETSRHTRRRTFALFLFPILRGIN